jgi:hypothetical protein
MPKTDEEIARTEGRTHGDQEIRRILSMPGIASTIRAHYSPSDAWQMFERITSRMMHERRPTDISASAMHAFCEGYLEAVRVELDKLFEVKA